MRKPVVILGGGLAGLGAAVHLEGAATLYERQASLGGLCGQASVAGFRFDAVPHVLHFRDPAVLEFVTQLLGHRLRAYRRDARVATHGTFLRYPFQAHLHGLPPAVVKECVDGRLAAGRCGPPETGTFDRWIATCFGDGIARHFMVPYNTKFWTLPPSTLTCEWLDGLVPVPTSTETIRGALEDDPTEYGYNVEFWYPSPGGLGALVQAFLERVPRLRLDKRLVRIDTAHRHLHFADGEMVAYDHLLSSIPLPELRGLLDPLPHDVAEALDALRWTSIAVVHLGLNTPARVPWHWAYVPDPEMAFYRVGIPSHYAPDAAPEGCSIVSAEISYAPWRPLERAHLMPRVITELRRLGIVGEESDVVVRKIVELPYGYPIYDRQYGWATTRLYEYLGTQAITPFGRFGSWRYLSVEQTLLDGHRAAAAIAGDHPAIHAQGQVKSLTPG